MKTADKNKRLRGFDGDAASKSNDRNGDRDPRYNRNNSQDPDSRTFNEDEESWEKKNAVGYFEDDKDDRDAADYINSDHSDYNRTIGRFGWYEPEE